MESFKSGSDKIGILERSQWLPREGCFVRGSWDVSLGADTGQDFGGGRGDGVKGLNWRCIVKVEPEEPSDGLDAQSEGSTVISSQG